MIKLLQETLGEKLPDLGLANDFGYNTKSTNNFGYYRQQKQKQRRL